MAFRLKRQESISTGIARVLDEELTGAITSLQRAKAAPAGSPVRDSGVHLARKSIKKLRAVMRLLEPRLGRLAGAENVVLRDAARSLSGARDSASALEILDTLTVRYQGSPGLRSLAALKRRLLARPAAPALEVDAALKALAEVRARVSKWPPLPENFRPLATGLRRTYRKGRAALAVASAEPTPDAFHTLRKRVKDHWYQVRLLEGAWPAAEPREQELRQLQECLGDEHNLTLLEDTVVLVPAVRKLVDRARAEFREQSLALARSLYSQKPQAHAGHAHQLWNAWHRARTIARKAPAAARSYHSRQSVA